MLRKIVAAIILVPLAVIIIAFSVANRQSVTVSFDPFSASAPAATLTLPLFALIILLLIIGVLIGGLASWLRQGKWRSAARRLERDVHALHKKVAIFESAAREHTIVPDDGAPPQPLRLKPPVR